MTDRSESGHADMPNGSTLFWAPNPAGGRTYYSDEIGGGVLVWDTALVYVGTLCYAIAHEQALQAAERRAADVARVAAARQSELSPEDRKTLDDYLANWKPPPKDADAACTCGSVPHAINCPAAPLLDPLRFPSWNPPK